MILTKTYPSSNDIVTSIEESWVRAWMLFGKLPGARIRDDARMTRLVTERGDSLLNAVLRSTLGTDELSREIDEWAEFSRNKKIPVSWHVSSSTQFSHVDSLLTDKGFRLQEISIGMVLDPSIKIHQPRTPTNLSIMHVKKSDDIDQWVSILRRAYPFSEVLAEAMSIVIRNSQFANGEENYHYMGVLDNEPTASLTLSIWQGIASIYDVATLPASRRRGIATAMTLAACMEARQRECKMVVLQSSDMARDIYQRIGFREYCLFRQYVLNA